jgi:hypothetical protein
MRRRHLDKTIYAVFRKRVILRARSHPVVPERDGVVKASAQSLRPGYGTVPVRQTGPRPRAAPDGYAPVLSRNFIHLHPSLHTGQWLPASHGLPRPPACFPAIASTEHGTQEDIAAQNDNRCLFQLDYRSWKSLWEEPEKWESKFGELPLLQPLFFCETSAKKWCWWRDPSLSRRNCIL